MTFRGLVNILFDLGYEVYNTTDDPEFDSIQFRRDIGPSGQHEVVEIINSDNASTWRYFCFKKEKFYATEEMHLLYPKTAPQYTRLKLNMPLKRKDFFHRSFNNNYEMPSL